MRLLILSLIVFLISPLASAKGLTVTCGESTGYGYYFEGGAVNKKNSGFTTDGITGGLFTLTLDEKNNGDMLSKDATGVLKSATSQGGIVTVMDAGDNGLNWIVLYPGGIIEVYSLNISSMKMASYRNTVGNPLVAKNSLFISDCSVI